MDEKYIQKISEYLAAANYFLHLLTWYDIVFAIGAFVFALSFIYGFVISPLIFRLYIIPGIEKKVGRKLQYHPFVNTFPLTGVEREISAYIAKINRDYKNLNYTGLPMGYDNYSLKKVGYTIKMVSKAEIFFCYASLKNVTIGAITLFFTGILSILHQNHYI